MRDLRSNQSVEQMNIDDVPFLLPQFQINRPPMWLPGTCISL